MNIFITGSSGFIGERLTKKLSKKYTVIEYDIKQGFDILEDNSLFKKMAACDIVIHLAALVNQSESWTMQDAYSLVNYTGTRKVLAAGRKNKIKKFIFLSSAAVYSRDITPYGLSKRKAEHACREYSKYFDVIIMRPFNLYGKGQNRGYNYAIHNFIRNIKNGKAVSIFGDGTQTRDFMYIDDFLNIIEHAINANPIKKTIDVGTGTEIKIKDLASMVAKIMKKPFDINYHPKRREPFKSKADIRNLKAWGINTDSFLNLEQGLRKVIF